ncbi:MAG: hypothetical protein A2284_11780 [Deltaproteobacteria bacterium RIFOXYA12_FULL_61_11]|nr:MAG: hypothetical protein A2284_11780 [Deltaproteobacteria bacterium RIFOXYA12_FULL_61_11]
MLVLSLRPRRADRRTAAWLYLLGCCLAQGAAALTYDGEFSTVNLYRRSLLDQSELLGEDRLWLRAEQAGTSVVLNAASENTMLDWHPEHELRLYQFHAEQRLAGDRLAVTLGRQVLRSYRLPLILDGGSARYRVRPELDIEVVGGLSRPAEALGFEPKDALVGARAVTLGELHETSVGLAREMPGEAEAATLLSVDHRLLPWYLENAPELYLVSTAALEERLLEYLALGLVQELGTRVSLDMGYERHAGGRSQEGEDLTLLEAFRSGREHRLVEGVQVGLGPALEVRQELALTSTEGDFGSARGWSSDLVLLAGDEPCSLTAGLGARRGPGGEATLLLFDARERLTDRWRLSQRGHLAWYSKVTGVEGRASELRFGTTWDHGAGDVGFQVEVTDNPDVHRSLGAVVLLTLDLR